MDPFSDQALVEEARSGSNIAFDRLMERYQRLVYRISYSYTRDPEEAMDVTQNVFLKAFEKLSTYRGSGAFRSWLIRIAHRESINWMRSRRYLESFEDLGLDDAPRASATQESDLLRQERRARLTRALGDLNPKQRLAVALRYYESLPARDIAAVLKCSEGTARSLLFRSLEKLRQSWALKEAL